ncbi:hypothetical protein GCM10009347_26590 [Shewanella algicola]|uniref:Uncharacterized protein n=1 Tax=Shewanella algicola TaxID=640633 RepID=A0A9X1Z9Z7_9GAMM|nr:hypothetical protein [Shewanella algicola]MCL1106367.1 hypothetical protein [Shewanella algicola]GGP58873.1 hypothetical protein GCM10009347_26590 [Shewanella algicola]
MRLTDSTMNKLFHLNLDDRSLLKALRREVLKANTVFGKEAVTEFLAELYPFYSDSSEPLRLYLLNKYEQHFHHNPVAKSIEVAYEKMGIAVLSDGDGKFKVIHPNVKSSSRVKYPIQVSTWYISRGVCGDSLHCSISSAITDNALTSLSIVDENQFDEIEDALVTSEAAFQSRYKANTGEYCLN